MTDHSSTPTAVAAGAAYFDTGPLSWVIGEIRDALDRSRAALADALDQGQDARLTSLQHARTHLHQAHGALQMVDIEGVGLLTAAAETAIERMRDGQLAVDGANGAAISDAYQAITEYLDELMAGAAPQPARLFPYHRALQQLLGAERIHPSDLLFVDLSVSVPLPPPAGAPDGAASAEPATAAPDYAACRARFEKALLPFLKSADATAQRVNAQALQEAIALVERAQVEAPARTFWLAMRCFAELVASGQVNGDLYVKQLFGLINLQIRRLSQGQASLPEAMLRDALFFIAAATAPSADAQLLRRAYGLAGVVPADYDSQRYGRIDPQALKTAKDALAQTKTGWDRVAAEPGVALEDGFNQALATLAGASDQLGAPALAQLLRELGRAASDSIASGRSDQFSMEMATAMLFVEHGLDQVRQLPDDFAEHAEVVGARLLALAAGETPPDAPQWQGELSRQIAQGQTVAVLAGEMKTALRQVEKVLDDYYADASRRPALAGIDPLLHQLQGALAILDQDQAVLAAQHVRDQVAALAAGPGDAAADADALQNIARNVGAMGFYIDMLGLDFDAAQHHFRFDAQGGRFEEVPFEKPSAGDTLFDVEPVIEAAPAPVPAPTPAPVAASAPPPAASAADGEAAIEAELLEIFIGEAQEVLEFVGATLPAAVAEPSNQQTLTMLRRSFHTLKGSGRMVGLDNFANGAAAVEKVMNTWLGEARAATPAVLALLGHASGDMAAWVDELASRGASARDSAALVAAAAVVQDGGDFALAQTAVEATPPVDADADIDVDVDVDVDAAEVDDAPHALMPTAPAPDEQASDIDADAVGNVDDAAAPATLAESLATAEAAEPAETAEAAETLEAAGSLEDAEPVEPAALLEAAGALDAAETVEEAEAAEPAEAAETAEAVEAAETAETAEAAEPADTLAAAPTPPAAGAQVIEFPSALPQPPLEDNVRRFCDLEIPLPLYNIYLAETDELMRLLTQDFGEWRHEPWRAVTPAALKAAHTLAGTSATVGFKALRAVAHALEMALLPLVEPAPVLSEPQRDILDQALAAAAHMLRRFAQGELPPPQPELVERLVALRETLSAQAPADAASVQEEGATAHADGSNQAPAFDGAPDFAFDERFDEPILAMALPEDDDEVEAVEQADAAQEAPTPAGPSDLADDAGEHAAHAANLNDEGDEGDDGGMLRFDPDVDGIAPPLDGADDAAAAAAAAEAVAAAEAADEPAEAAAAATATATATPNADGADQANHAPSSAPAAADTADTAAAAAAPGAEAEASPLAERAIDTAAAPLESAIADELDADLLPVFIEEAVDLLPAVGAGLRQWQAKPADSAPAQSLLRTLHTVKGSARMAGAMRLGQLTHEIETQIENMVHAGTTTAAAFDEVLANYDHAMLLFEQLQHPPAPAVATDAVTAAAAAAPQAAATAASATGAAGAAAPAGMPATPLPAPRAEQGNRNALVRVRADILDRLVNQAGEVSITRSKLETQVGTLKTSLNDFSENLARLSRQLREVEMQAESQIASRMAISSEREFDPLEFDRFTRLQELTRMMAESVNDVASFHDSLSRTVDAANIDLAQQSRLTRDLQRDLMRVRMVPFGSLSERLFRVARQSAKELDKRVNLDIRGSAVEIDRSVLEQMAAPFEHLLRNAIVHGIESRERRGAAGKAETGELLMQVSQQGNEVVIQISDDGAGLDLDKIRAKAAGAGLVAEGVSLSDHEAAEMIFEPGFSTADSLSELAGRGVGMDVVRSEAQALGGRVAIASERGRGARFTIHLPLTLAVTQVVLTASAGKTYALPSILVEQVLQMKEGVLAEAQAAGFVRYQGQRVALHYLPTLLGDASARPLAQRSSPVLILKSGVDRLAVQVDEVVGNREVVIKNIGPQLARMVGIAGATVLGSGDIVLILNPVALSLHGATRAGVLPGIGQPAEPAAPSRLPPRQAVVMVVDDSLTVRRVTQRLLEREGYRVILAKDGVDALEHLQETIPDLMLVDIEMPRMDGFDLTRNIRGNDSTAAVPIIMITSRTADKHRNYALGLGVNAYFGKPFQEDMLLAAIAGLLGRALPVSVQG